MGVFSQREIGLGGPPAQPISTDEMVSGGSYKGYGSPNLLDIPASLGKFFTDLSTGAIWVKQSGDRLPSGWILASAAGEDVQSFGAVGDGSTDDYAALTDALASEDRILIQSGTLYIGTNLTIASGKTLVLYPGAKLKPASGVKVSIYGQIVAGRHEIFDYSASGTCVFPITGIGQAQKNSAIEAEWYGAVGDNGSTNNAAAFARICGGATSDNQLKVSLSASYYNFVTGFTPKNKQTFEGVPGRLTRLQFSPTSTARFITIDDSAFDIRLKNLQISSTITSGSIRTTAIGVASDAHTANNINLEDVEITNFNQRGIDVGAWIDCRWTRVRFENISNLAIYGGTGTGPATCIYVREFLNAAKITDVDSSNCDQFARIDSATKVDFFGGDHDQTNAAGTGLDAITGLESFMYFLDGESITVVDLYMEGIGATGGNAMIEATGVDNMNVSFNRITNLRGVSNVASIFVRFGAGCQGSNAGGNMFKGSPGTSWIEVNAAGGYCSTFPENVFRDAAGTQFLTYASVLSRMSEARTDMLLPDGMHWARPVSLAKLTKVQRDALTGVNGMMIYQTDNTPGIRFFEDGAWVRPSVTADP